MIDRRQVLRSMAALAGARSCVVRAQSARRPMRVGYLGNVSPNTPGASRVVDAFLLEMRRLGWIEGSNVRYEFRFVDGAMERFVPFARELVTMKVDVIAAMGTTAAQVAKEETSTIPIVFIAAEPMEYGLIPSLSHPGGNLTGLTYPVDPLMGKRMQILTQAVPGITRIAYLGMHEAKSIGLAQASAKALKAELLLAQVKRPDELPSAIASAPSADAWLIDDYPMFNAHRRQIIGLIEAQRKPAVYSSVSWTRDGGLLAYSADAVDIWRRAAGYVDRILRGAKPGDLPVEDPVRYLLGVNLSAARRLGIAIARDVLLQADEVIQ